MTTVIYTPATEAHPSRLQAAAYRALDAALAEADARCDYDRAVAFLFYSVRSVHATADDRREANSACNRRLQDKTEKWQSAQNARFAAEEAYVAAQRAAEAAAAAK